MKTIKLHISGMDCPSCASKLERMLLKIDGIETVSVSHMLETATLEYHNDEALSEAKKKIVKLGYHLDKKEDILKKSPQASCEVPEKKGNSKAQFWKDQASFFLKQPQIKNIFIFVGILSVAILASWIFPKGERIFIFIALIIGLFPTLKEVKESWLSGEFFTIETLMTVAVFGAWCIQEEIEGAAVVILFFLGEALEGYAAHRARTGIQSLKELTPTRALLLSQSDQDSPPQEIDAPLLKEGDIILVRPGDRIAADGLILEGKSTVNEASLTGESVPRFRSVNDEVFASTINIEGALKVRVTKTSEDNMISRVIRIVEEAQEAKAPTQRFIDKFSRHYTPFVFLIGMLVILIPPLFFGGEWSEWIYKGLALFLIGCPCALVISTPAAIVSSLANAAHHGVLIKGGEILETMGKVTKVAFDKTGTLTEGKVYVTDIIPYNFTREELLSLATGLESTSSHPLADAIRKVSLDEHISEKKLEHVEVIIGKGVSASLNKDHYFFGSVKVAAQKQKISEEVEQKIQQLASEGKTVSVITQNNQIIGIFALRDEPREDAKEGINSLKELGINTIMVTGDSKTSADAIGKELGMDAIYSELLPEDKLKVIKTLQQQGDCVAKVGDGINDAPGLAAADVGIAMGQATDVALETADVALLSGQVRGVAKLVTMSKHTLSVIYQNITLSLGLKAFFLVTTLLGVSGLWEAILADTGATVLVTMNSLRLLRGKDLL